MIGPSSILRSTAAIMCLVALVDLPYAYYQILRWVVCISAIWTAFIARSANRTGWTVALVVIAILFNPIAPIHLERQTWAVVDVLTAILFVASLRSVRDQRGPGAAPT